MDVITEGPDHGYVLAPCSGATRVQAGVRLAVDVPSSCLAHLAAETRFRIDTYLWRDGFVLPTDQWWDALPDEGGFALHRGLRPAGAPDPSVDGPVYDPEGPVGTLHRMYRVALLRDPDPEGLAHWLRASWSGHPVTDVAAMVASSAEHAAVYGTLTDDLLVRSVYEQALGRAPDPAGLDWWTAQLRAGLSRGAFLLHVAESPEVRTLLAGKVPPGYRAAA